MDFIRNNAGQVSKLPYEGVVSRFNRLYLNRDISGIETLLLFTEPQYAHISSSVVRELLRFNQPVKQFIPQNLVLPDVR